MAERRRTGLALFEVIHTRGPREPRLPPATLALNLLGRAVLGVHEPVDVQQPVEVVVFVLHDAGEPAARLELEWLPVNVLRAKQGTRRAPQREPLVGEREASLNLILAWQPGLERRDPQHRVDRNALGRRFVLVVVHPYENTLADADLGGRKTNTGCRDSRLVHVVDELTQICIELGHGGCGAMKNGLTADGDRENCHEEQLTVATRLVTPVPASNGVTVSNAPAEQIVWIDCEMTGLDTDNDGLCEIAVIITDFDLTPLDPGFEVVINPGEAALAHMGDFVRNMHETSGLLPRIESGATVADAEAAVIDYVDRFVPADRRPLVAGNTIGMDRRFIAKYMPTLEERLHYRSIDVSTIKELSRRWYTRAYYGSPEKRGGHRALADIAESIQELAYFRGTVMVDGLGPDTKASKAVAETVSKQYAPLIDGDEAAGPESTVSEA